VRATGSGRGRADGGGRFVENGGVLERAKVERSERSVGPDRYEDVCRCWEPSNVVLRHPGED
jgi:hypothetical protein